MNPLTCIQEERLARVKFLQSEVTASRFTDEDCPKLASELCEMRVFVDRLSSAIRQMQATLKA